MDMKKFKTQEPKEETQTMVKSVVAPNVVTKSIKNYSLQGLSLILREGNSFITVWLSPKQSITVTEGQITQQIKNLHRRRLIKIGN